MIITFSLITTASRDLRSTMKRRSRIAYILSFKGRVNCFSMQVVTNKCFLLNPEIKFGVDSCCGDGGGVTRSLPTDGGVKELHGEPTVGSRPKVWSRGQNWKKWCRRWRARSTAPTSRRLIAVVRSPSLYPRGGPKWRDNYPKGPTIRSPPIVWIHLVVP